MTAGCAALSRSPQRTTGISSAPGRKPLLQDRGARALHPAALQFVQHQHPFPVCALALTASQPTFICRVLMF
jgi:hypothetical protein